MHVAASDREAVAAVVGLGPPAVEDRAVEHAVEDALLAARAARLQRAPRRVQPDVHSLHELPGDVHGVVFDEHDPAREAGVLLQVRHPLGERLAAGVARMGLAGVDDLHRPLGVVDQPVEAVEILEQQVGPLVGGEAAGEAEGERVGNERLALRPGETQPLPAVGQAAAGEGEQPRLEHLVDLPELGVAHAVDARPEVGVGDAVEPAGAQVLEQQRVHVRRHPGAHVDAVGDVADRHLLLGPARVEPLPHLARDAAMASFLSWRCNPS